MIIDQYPNIRKAFLEMSYDNGGINIGRTEEDAIAASEPVMSTIASEVICGDLVRLDEWLGTLSDYDIGVLTAGEETEATALAAKGPKSPDGFPLSDIFNDLFEVC